MKNHPLEIQSVGSDTYAVMSKGHHDFDEFMREVGKHWDWPLGNPQHVWIKTVPCNTDEYECYYHIVTAGTRGSWPATYSWEAHGGEQYIAPLSLKRNT